MAQIGRYAALVNDGLTLPFCSIASRPAVTASPGPAPRAAASYSLGLVVGFLDLAGAFGFGAGVAGCSGGVVGAGRRVQPNRSPQIGSASSSDGAGGCGGDGGFGFGFGMGASLDRAPI